MVLSNKQLTSKDIFDLYKGWYEEKFDTEYTPHGFIGNELSAIKKVVEGEGLYKTLCGLYVGLRDSQRQIKATYIMKGHWNYLPDVQRPDLYYLVLTKGTPDDKLNWRRLMHVENKWFPTADDAITQNELIMRLEESLNVKTKLANSPPKKKASGKKGSGTTE